MFLKFLKKYKFIVIGAFSAALISGLLYSGYLINPFRYGMETILLKWGSSGDYVYVVQDKLKRWGYYKGNIDGIYGTETRQAVLDFQRKNGLRADGIVGDETARALGMNVPPESSASSGGGGVRSNEVYTLAQCIHGEARGEPYIGQVAVGGVIMNRVRSPLFPNTIAGVIFQPGAFTAVDDGQMFQPPGDTAMKAAQDAINGWDPSGGALYYYNPAKATSSWIWSRPVIKVIGKHYFAR
ncbi:spore cortex-lytic enzyme [Lutispora sp.]|uniref:spore cortex-lytic enzyme n=1 Tax=Lutispora sp. TaxID=2828727 RepID=UPI002FDDE388